MVFWTSIWKKWFQKKRNHVSFQSQHTMWSNIKRS